jgi:hypothetical protein
LTHAISRVAQPRTVRLISNANHKPPVLLALASTHGALENLEALESLTSRRQEAQQKGVPGIAPGALASGYGYSFVNAAFAYTRPEGNRFNPSDWGVWYSAFHHDTALREVAYHLTRAIAAAGARFETKPDISNCSRMLTPISSICAASIQDRTACIPIPPSVIPPGNNWQAR